ncbi:MAG: hypothetical protein RR015_02135, partial [Bacteroidales bacterium]
MKIKTLLTIAVLTALTINATTAQNTISKKYTYRDTTVAEFYKVTVSSAINVIYRQNSDSSQIARI